MSYVAVLTGDVVGSTRLGVAEAMTLPERLIQAGIEASELASGVVSPVDVFRGDAWQLVVHRPADALAVAIRFRTVLRFGESLGLGVDGSGVGGIDSRVSIGVGPVDRVPRVRVSRGDGMAFRLSGRGLDTMPRGRRMAFRAGDPELEAEIDTLVELIDALIDRWTAAQARAVDYAMLGWNQTETAAAWQPEPITQQGVNSHLQRAGWLAIERALRRVEQRVGGGG